MWQSHDSYDISLNETQGLELHRSLKCTLSSVMTQGKKNQLLTVRWLLNSTPVVYFVLWCEERHLTGGGSGMWELKACQDILEGCPGCRESNWMQYSLYCMRNTLPALSTCISLFRNYSLAWIWTHALGVDQILASQLIVPAILHLLIALLYFVCFVRLKLFNSSKIRKCR